MVISNLRIPLMNRFTCTPRQLPNYIESIKRKQMVPIIDNVCENGFKYKENMAKIKADIDNYHTSTFAIKLSSFNLRDSNHSLLDIQKNVNDICQLANDSGSKIIIDAEEISINDTINAIADEMVAEHNKDQVVVYKTYQMYRRDTTKMLIEDLKKDKDYYMGVKLVRGAYYNQDVHSDKLFWKIEDTHRSYNEGIRYFLENSNKVDQLLCATHNYESNNIAKQHIHQGKKNIGIGHLLGMSDYLSESLSEEGVRVYKYLPYGEYQDTLPYLTRRLYENYPILGHMI